ncbi:hypothetical protein niasHT_032454 [Heterodera trifolii]|uniref:BTB domain-containing protein n=1 Tax=Heterodera trifolii TaxID=157864 RepID=A0ABD2HZW4_9BILA
MSQSVVDRMKNLLSTGEDADVYFLVGDGDEKELLSAHKLVLKHASEVFAAMFRFDAKNEKAEFASANCPVEVIDVEAAAFKVMLSFIYTGELAELNGDNAMAVLYAATKYDIPGLVGPTLQIPISELRNVFLAYAQAGLYELEAFANDGLFYIDKNADTLLKSEEFLQIDQKLLCEILERDELQINEEISIWKAALRWADSECRENGIESSAENRRAVLDSLWHCCVHSAIFRIISQKIEAANSVGTLGNFVLDNKLTNLGFPNFVSFAELMDPSNNFYNREEDKMTLAIDVIVDEPKTEKMISDPNKSNGTISIGIEKLSEFARQIILSERKSESMLQIKGFSWKILAQINPKNGSTDNNQKWLGIFLFCAASKDDKNWSCKCSTTFRIVSQKNGVPDFGGELNDNIFDNKENGLGYANFISFTELMDPKNGFYNKIEDKVTLAIDINVKEAKMEDKS